ncbi:hypothetical protein FRC12_018664 [Ceratobasidium sp. 428]|nr:hypothetical protein FRC12_018664 [Ceratobasidium sp. 428]
MATRRENGVGSLLRRTQRSENASPYKRRAVAHRTPPPPAKIPSSSSLSSFFSLLSAPFRRKPSSPVLPVAAASESGTSDDDASDDANNDEEEQEAPEPRSELGFGPPPKSSARPTVNARDPGAATTLSQMGRSVSLLSDSKIPPPDHTSPASTNYPTAKSPPGFDVLLVVL